MNLRLLLIILMTFSGLSLANSFDQDATRKMLSNKEQGHTGEQQYRIAILDRFFPPVSGFDSEEDRGHHLALYGLYDMDNDDQPEPLYHGDLVKLFAAHKDFNFLSYPIHNNQHPMADILTNLRKINARMSVQPVDALILSWESSTLISAFPQPLQRSRVMEYQQVVKKMGETSEVWMNTWLIIQELENLANRGVAVYTIAGNGGRRMINTFSLARGVITVGAVEQELEHFVSNNVFVDTYARAAYQLTRVDNSAGEPLGYDLNGDHCVDIPLSRMSNNGNSQFDFPKTFWKLLKGSSFAAPSALRAAFMANQLDHCDTSEHAG